MPPGATTVGLTLAFMEGFGVLTAIKVVWSMASWDMNLPTLLCAQHWVHRRQVVFHNGNVAWDVLCQTGIIAWGGALFGVQEYLIMMMVSLNAEMFFVLYLAVFSSAAADLTLVLLLPRFILFPSE